MKIESYLQRIGVEQRPAVDLAFLTHLQTQHTLHVPFENLDIHWGRPILLDPERFYRKVVEERRGGFCYELNGLLHVALLELGFASTMISARVAKSDGTGYGNEFGHLALVVSLAEGYYLVEVGFGDATRVPVPLSGTVVSDGMNRYRIVREEAEQNVYLYQFQKEDEWVNEYRFALKPRSLSEFAEMCRYHQESPLSHFTQKKMVTQATSEGRITLTSEMLTRTVGGAKEKLPVQGEEEFAALLQQYFGLAR